MRNSPSLSGMATISTTATLGFLRLSSKNRPKKSILWLIALFASCSRLKFSFLPYLTIKLLMNFNCVSSKKKSVPEVKLHTVVFLASTVLGDHQRNVSWRRNKLEVERERLMPSKLSPNGQLMRLDDYKWAASVFSLFLPPIMWSLNWLYWNETWQSQQESKGTEKKSLTAW